MQGIGNFGNLSNFSNLSNLSSLGSLANAEGQQIAAPVPAPKSPEKQPEPASVVPLPVLPKEFWQSYMGTVIAASPAIATAPVTFSAMPLTALAAPAIYSATQAIIPSQSYGIDEASEEIAQARFTTGVNLIAGSTATKVAQIPKPKAD